MPKELLMELDPDERILVEVKRHPISDLYIMIVAGFLFFISLLALFFGIRYAEDIGIGDYKAIFSLFMLVVLGLITLFTWAAIYINRKNEFIVTNENLIQLLQFGLFNKQVSQLNLAKIQDVSVDQNGPIATALNFGVVEVETAGEISNFRFIYVPDPNRVAKIIIEAHEDYIESVGSAATSRL